jgi:hypothetical protein
MMTAEELLLDRTDPVLLVCSIHEDQRPLKGVAGLLDWGLKGFLSRFVRSGRITGAPGEFVYVPITRHGHVRHLMIVGLGPKGNEGSGKLLDELASRVAALKFDKVAICQSSFPFYDAPKLRHALKGVEVEVIQ